MGIQEVEQAVFQLPPKEVARFRKCFDGFDAQIWDKHWEADAESGKLDKIAGQALNEQR